MTLKMQEPISIPDIDIANSGTRLMDPNRLSPLG